MLLETIKNVLFLVVHEEDRMGLSVELTDCNGKILDRVEDPKNFLHRALPSMSEGTQSILAKVDWYGDTYFNYLQIRQFLEEWNVLTRSALTEEEKKLVENIKRLALTCQSDRGMLRFIGD